MDTHKWKPKTSKRWLSSRWIAGRRRSQRSTPQKQFYRDAVKKVSKASPELFTVTGLKYGTANQYRSLFQEYVNLRGGSDDKYTKPDKNLIALTQNPNKFHCFFVPPQVINHHLLELSEEDKIEFASREQVTDEQELSLITKQLEEARRKMEVAKSYSQMEGAYAVDIISKIQEAAEVMIKACLMLYSKESLTANFFKTCPIFKAHNLLQLSTKLYKMSPFRCRKSLELLVDLTAKMESLATEKPDLRPHALRCRYTTLSANCTHAPMDVFDSGHAAMSIASMKKINDIIYQILDPRIIEKTG